MPNARSTAPSRRRASQSGKKALVGDSQLGGPAGAARPAGPSEPPPRSTWEPAARLAAIGVSPATAASLVEKYGTQRVVDALDAVATLDDDEVSLRVGWVLSAVREGWDLDNLLTERRTAAARLARWEAERVERDRDTARWRSHESVTGQWRGAISAALDDRQLATAVERITTPVAGLGRRSVPIVRTQLLAWAVTAHREAPTRPLAEALADDLVGTDRMVSAPSLEGPIPAVPGVGPAPDDLTTRLTDLLARRPDLAMPGPENPEGARGEIRRSLGGGFGLDR